jgi:kumamolisin
VLEDAAERGISICGSSGDSGAYDDPENKKVCVNFPASSPLVLACGGTTVMRFESAIEKEVVWNCGAHGLPAATGGGVSEHFARPDWQESHTPPAAPSGFAGRGLTSPLPPIRTMAAKSW